MTSDPGLQFQAVDAFVDLVETLALGGPLVLGVDDLQWTDPSSLLTLAAVARVSPTLRSHCSSASSPNPGRRR